MQILTALIFSIVFASCSSNKIVKEDASIWKGIKDSFRFKKLTNFNIDTALANDYYNRGKVYQDFLKPKDPILDSILLTRHYLLYSWQSSTPLFTSFTVLSEGMGEALELHYLIFDKNNNVVSHFAVANRGGEPGGHKYQLHSILKSKDTLISTSTRTYFVDQKTLQRLSYPVGDTIHVRQVIDDKGFIHRQPIDSILTTQRYRDENGWVTQDMINKHNRNKYYR